MNNEFTKKIKKLETVYVLESSSGGGTGSSDVSSMSKGVGLIQSRNTQEETEPQYDKSHGSPWDRGAADAYYGRGCRPHKWLDRLGTQRVKLTDPEEIAAYNAGYEYVEQSGDRKDWGEPTRRSGGRGIYEDPSLDPLEYQGYKIEANQFVNKAANSKYWYAKTQMGKKPLATKGNNREDAIAKLKIMIDQELKSQPTVSHHSINIDFNAPFVNKILNGSADPFYAKFTKNENGGLQLVIAGKEMLKFGDELKSLGFRRSAIRMRQGEQTSTPFPSININNDAQLKNLGLISNGRYEIYNEKMDKDGNRVFDLKFDSRTISPKDKVRLQVPAFTVGVSKSKNIDMAEGDVLPFKNLGNTEMPAEFINWLRNNYKDLPLARLNDPAIRNDLLTQFRLSQKQGMAEGPKKGLVDLGPALKDLEAAMDYMISTDPNKQQNQQDVKKRIKDDPMSGPKGKLPEQGVAENEHDMEGETVKNSLHTIIRVATHLNKNLSDEAEVPEWVSEKIGIIKSMMVGVMDYIISNQEMGSGMGVDQSIGEGKFEYNKKTGQMEPSSRKPDERWGLFRNGKLVKAFWGQDAASNAKEKTPNYHDTEVKRIDEDWQKVNKKDKTDGMSRKAVKAYRRENPGSKLKTAVTTKPGKLKKGSKSAKRRKSFCARMGGMKKSRASAKTKRDPNSPINKALRRWNCEDVEHLEQMLESAKVNLLNNKDYEQVNEVSKTKKQARTMAAAAHDPKFAKKLGIKQSVARDFNRADTGTKRLSQAMKDKAKKDESQYLESLTTALERQLNPNDPVEKYQRVFANANPEQYHQFRVKNRPGTSKARGYREKMANAASYQAKTSRKK